MDALVQMSRKGLEYVFVESSGFGDPSNAEEILAATEVMAPDAYDFKGCICLVDCYNFLDQVGDSETIDRQLKHCNLAVLTKIDLVDENQIEKVKEKAREINPVCPITESANGNIDRSFYDMDLMLYKWAECEDTTNSSKNKPKTFSMDFTGEIQKEKLEAFLAKIEPDVFRVKGFFKVEKEGWEKVDVVGKKTGLCALRTTAEVSACLYFQNRNRTDPGNRGSVGGMCGTSYEIEQLNLEVGYEYKSNW